MKGNRDRGQIDSFRKINDSVLIGTFGKAAWKNTQGRANLLQILSRVGNVYSMQNFTNK